MVKMIKTRYFISKNNFVYPECPYAKDLEFLSGEMLCKHPVTKSGYCSDNTDHNSCPFDIHAELQGVHQTDS